MLNIDDKQLSKVRSQCETISIGLLSDQRFCRENLGFGNQEGKDILVEVSICAKREEN